MARHRRERHARHRPRRDLLTSRGTTSPPPTADTLDVTDAEAVDRGRRAATTWSSTPPPGPPSTPPRSTRTRPWRSTPRRRRLLARAAADARCPAGADQHRLRVRRRRPPRRTPRTPRSRPRSAYGRTKAARRGGRARGAAPTATCRPHRLAVRRPRRLLPQDHRPAWPASGASVDVVDDQVGQPTWTDRRRRLLVDAGRRPRRPPGPTTPRPSGQCSWFDFARTVVVAAGLESSTVQPTTSEAFVRPAPRPAYSVLGHEALTGLGLEPDRRLGGAVGGGRPRGARPARPDASGPHGRPLVEPPPGGRPLPPGTALRGGDQGQPRRPGHPQRVELGPLARPTTPAPARPGPPGRGSR